MLGETEQGGVLAAAGAGMVVSPSVHEMVLYGELSEQARALAATAGAGIGVSQSMHEAAVLGDYHLQDRALALGAGRVPVQGAIPPTFLMRSAGE